MQPSPQLTSIGTVTTRLPRRRAVQKHCVQLTRLAPILQGGNSWPWQYCHSVIRVLFSGVKSFHPFKFKPSQSIKCPQRRFCRENAKTILNENVEANVQLYCPELLFAFGTCDASSFSHQTKLSSISFREVPSQASSLAHTCFTQTQKDLYIINRDVTNNLWPNCLEEAGRQNLIFSRHEGPFIIHDSEFHKYQDCFFALMIKWIKRAPFCQIMPF